MAISGSFYGKTGNSAIKPKITWSAEINAGGNFSVVTATLTYSRTDSYTTSGYWAGTLTINGDTKSVSGKYIQISKNSNTQAITHTVQVPHGENGGGSVTISATGAIADTTLTKTVISAQVLLEAIPRAATISATDGDIGSVSMVVIQRTSLDYTYEVAWEFGSLSGYLGPDGSTEVPVRVSEPTLAFSLPEEFYGQIPQSPTGVCRLTCTTYNGEEPIGEPQQTQFTVRANPNLCGPVLEYTVIDVDPVTLALTGDENRFIQGASTALCSLYAQARCGAAITQQRIGGIHVPDGSLTVEGIAGDRVYFFVSDSRGYTAQAEAVLDMLPYFPPTGRLTAARTDATSGNGSLLAEGSFRSGSFGAGENALSARFQINGGQWQTLQAQTDGDSYQLQADLTGLDYTASHRITVEVSDALTSLTLTAQINPGVPVFDWGREDFAFHVPVTVEGINILEKLQAVLAAMVKRTGDTMEGDLDMGENRLSGLPEPEGDTDAATKSYVDRKLSVKRVWANETPGEDFSAQTVSLELTGGSGVSIYYKNQSNGTACKSTGFIPMGGSVMLQYVPADGVPKRRECRVSETGVEFETGYDGSTTGAKNCIPLEIYLWKGVTM